MSGEFYTVDAQIEKIRGVHRAVTLPSGDRFEVGVHGPVKDHYGLNEEPDRPLPVDFLVGAAGA